MGILIYGSIRCDGENCKNKIKVPITFKITTDNNHVYCESNENYYNSENTKIPMQEITESLDVTPIPNKDILMKKRWVVIETSTIYHLGCSEITPQKYYCPECLKE